MFYCATPASTPRSGASELGKGASDGEAIVDTQGSPV